MASCPASPDHSSALQKLINSAQTAQTETQGKAFGAEMWTLWADAPDERAQAVLDRGLVRLRSRDMLGAIADFNVLIDYCPDYAEGYNQRAFANFLQGRFEPAAIDLQKALELSPYHVAAQAGLALTFMNMGETDLARRELMKALDLNPWLSERHLLAKGGPLAPEGQDI